MVLWTFQSTVRKREVRQALQEEMRDKLLPFLFDHGFKPIATGRGGELEGSFPVRFFRHEMIRVDVIAFTSDKYHKPRFAVEFSMNEETEFNGILPVDFEKRWYSHPTYSLTKKNFRGYVPFWRWRVSICVKLGARYKKVG